MEGELEGVSRLLPTEAMEAIPVEIAAGGDRRRGEDGAADAEERATDHERHDHDRRVELHGVAHHLRHEDVVLELLNTG